MQGKNNIMKLLIQSVLLVFYVTQLSAQKPVNHTVLFDEGQTSISLQQLDSLKEVAIQVKETEKGRVVVYSYANDAAEGDSNFRLSRRRAFLMLQCLEREGISMRNIQVENKVRHANESDACNACAEILITTDSNFFNQNLFHRRIATFLENESEIEVQTFWIHPFESSLITTKEGLLIRMPEGTLATKDSSLVKLEVRYLKNKWDMLLHSLGTRSFNQKFLELNRAVHLSASLNGEALEMSNNKLITVVVPSDVYTRNAEMYIQEGESWLKHPLSGNLKTGTFYSGDSFFCNDSNATLSPPQYDLPPLKPTHIKYESVTALQDEQLKTIQIRLDYYDEQKYDENGKKQELNPQLKRKEYLLNSKKQRLLIAREKIIMQTREKNKGLDEQYYKSLAVYNKQRNLKQRAYISKVDSLGSEQKAKISQCQEHKNSIKDLKKTYPQDVYEQIFTTLLNHNSSGNIGYWAQTNQLGWVSIGNSSKRAVLKSVPYRVVTDLSAYKITAFLIFDDNQDIVIGEVLDDSDIVFREVPEGETARLLAVTKDDEGFKVAFHHIIINGSPVLLEFKKESLKPISNYLK